MFVEARSEGRIVVELPSGDRLIVDCCGESDADRIMIHSYDSGDGDSPAILDLVVPDPDTVYASDDDVRGFSDVHRVARAVTPPRQTSPCPTPDMRMSAAPTSFRRPGQATIAQRMSPRCMSPENRGPLVCWSSECCAEGGAARPAPKNAASP